MQIRNLTLIILLAITLVPHKSHSQLAAPYDDAAFIVGTFIDSLRILPPAERYIKGKYIPLQAEFEIPEEIFLPRVSERYEIGREVSPDSTSYMHTIQTPPLDYLLNKRLRFDYISRSLDNEEVEMSGSVSLERKETHKDNKRILTQTLKLHIDFPLFKILQKDYNKEIIEPDYFYIHLRVVNWKYNQKEYDMRDTIPADETIYAQKRLCYLKDKKGKYHFFEFKKHRDGTHYALLPELTTDARSLYKHLQEKMNYPPELIETDTEGNAFIEITTDNEGAINKQELIYSDHPLFNEEAMRLATLTEGHWTPDSKIILPILFRERNQPQITPLEETVTSTIISTGKSITGKLLSALLLLTIILLITGYILKKKKLYSSGKSATLPEEKQASLPNDKMIYINGLSFKEARQITQEIIYIPYKQEKKSIAVNLYMEIKGRRASTILTFPEDISFELFCYIIYTLQKRQNEYPDLEVKGWSTLPLYLTKETTWQAMISSTPQTRTIEVITPEGETYLFRHDIIKGIIRQEEPETNKKPVIYQNPPTPFEELLLTCTSTQTIRIIANEYKYYNQ